MITFLIGLIIGSWVGLFTAGLCRTAKTNDVGTVYASHYCYDCQNIWHRQRDQEDDNCPRCGSDEINIGRKE